MRKRMAVCSAVLLAFAVLFAGCSGDDDNGNGGGSQNALLGRWTWSRLVVYGVTWSPANPFAFTPGGSTTITPAVLGQLGVTANLTQTFNADGTVTATVNATMPGEPPVNQTVNGTWSVSGDELRVQLTYQGTTYRLAGDYEVTSSRLTVSLSNAQLLDLLDVNGADLSDLTPDQEQLLRSLSGTIEFTK